MNNLYPVYNEYELAQQRLAERHQEAARWRLVRSLQKRGSFGQYLRQLYFLLSKEPHLVTWSPQPTQVNKALYS